MNMEEIIQVSGGFGTYQKIVTFFTFFFYFFHSMFTYSVAYWYYQPEFLCLQGNGVYSKCPKSEACSGQNYKLLAERKSLVTEFHLECSDISERHLIWMFLAISLSSLVLQLFGDLIGRKQVFLYCNLFGYMTGGLLGFFGSNLYQVTLGIFLIFLVSHSSITFAIILSSESLPNDERSRHGIFISFFICLGAVVFCVSQFFLNDYRYSFLLSIVFQLFMLPYCFWVKETLYYLQDSLDFRQTLQNLIYIHDFNGMDNTALIKKLLLINIDPKVILQNTRKITFKQRSSSLIMNFLRSVDKNFFFSLFKILLLSSHFECLEQFLPLNIQFLTNYNMNVNGVVIALQELLGCYLVINYYHDNKRMNVFRICSFF